MNRDQLLNYILKKLNQEGVEKSQCIINQSEKKELNIDAGDISLFRTTFNINLGITAYINGRKGSISINKSDTNSIDMAISNVLDLAKSSEPDKAFDISELVKNQSFECGEGSCNMDMMYERLLEFKNHTDNTYTNVILEQAILDYTFNDALFMNSNGVKFNIKKGLYSFGPMFTAKDGENTSSFNYTGFTAKKITSPLHQYGSINKLLSESQEQTITKPINEKFVGEVIITPDCLDDFISILTNFISDMFLITGRSVYKEKLNNRITSSIFTLHSNPTSSMIQDNYFITSDGYIAENSTIIDKGVLKTYLLSLYGANKTGLDRAVNDGGAFIVDPGETNLSDMINSVEKGIMLCRFSGGNPSDNGDFSGIAKNSYYIENGKIKYPVSETMISGNICEMLNEILEISKETIDFGSCIYPWIKFDGLTIS